MADASSCTGRNAWAELPHGYGRLARERRPFREPLRIIVITVISVMSGIFPYTYRVFYMTVKRSCVQGPSRHRHGERHGEIGLGMRYSRPDDDDDANDGDIRAYSRQGRRLYFVDLYPLHPDPTNPTHRARSPVPMRSSRPLAASGLSNLAGNQTPLPDDSKHLTYAGYCGHRRVCRVL